MAGIDRLLAEAIKHHWDKCNGTNKDVFVQLTDADVLAMLKTSPSIEATQIIHTILYEPYRIQISENLGKGYPISVQKIYNKIPLCNGDTLTSINAEAKNMVNYLSTLVFDLEVCIST
ncbi:hypothetical protein J14TS2_33180 [Bacillus sp. J14TS2]|uniref:hypothetical protein n=1 Tax=Bacillus sp. J14TS2 TaxID=2807188 RepID=UPI001B00B071|nr:hypothetical protein [Bacillus sp. J14TS2]GIN72843.1 hypothetical protein J14TS2_33180 [Bacillus sp. J14TS2]